ncbi:AAA family ATPase [[Kitasatospora] papulosa]|uniref:AAA family ATPase n=1 Tax=[Kitasatospora] papulosa TaxID=1464011 RepID=UPI0036BDD364
MEHGLYEALLSLRHAAEQTRKLAGKPVSAREVANEVESARKRAVKQARERANAATNAAEAANAAEVANALAKGARLSNARISDWVPPRDKVESREKLPVVPRDFDPLWAIVQVWSRWAGQTPNRRYWKNLHEAARSARTEPAAPPADVPFTLPPTARFFVGRDDQLGQLREALDPDGAEQGIQGAAIHGMAGVGKTDLALHMAYEAMAEGWFAGGVLFVDLQGYDEERSLSADQAAGELLGQAERAEGTAPSARLNAYRKMLRAAPGPMLVVLDNASSADQVSPLRLPGGGRGHRMLVTSRYKLPSLAGLRQVDLSVMTPAESTELIRRHLGAADPQDDRVGQAPEEAVRLARLCGYLPLALHIVAALLEIEPDRPLVRLADELTDERGRLQLLHPGDTAEGPVRAAFTLSYRHLGVGNPERGDALRALFSLLPLGPFPDPSTSGAAALLRKSVEETRPLLRELRRAHLIEPGRRDEFWRMHDLIHLYAVELCLSDMSAADRDDAFRRAGIAETYRVHRDLAHALEWAGRVVARFNGWGDALAWPDAERSRRLLYADELAVRTGHTDAHAYLKAGIVAYGEQHLPGESVDEILEFLTASLQAGAIAVRQADAIPVEWDEEQEAGTDERPEVSADELTVQMLSRLLADVARTAAAGRYDEAIEVLTEAAEALRQRPSISPFYEAWVLQWTGEIRAMQGQLSGTRRAWRRAIELLTEAGKREEAESLRSKLRQLPPPRAAKKRR